MNTGNVKQELPVVKKKMRDAMKKRDIKLATGFAAILADLEVLDSKGVENFIVFDDGTIQGVAS